MPAIYKSRYMLPPAVSELVSTLELDGLSMPLLFAALGIRWQGANHGRVVRELSGLMVAAGYRYDGRIWSYKRGKRKDGIGRGRYV